MGRRRHLALALLCFPVPAQCELPRITIPRTPVNKGMKKDRGVEAPILPPPRCAPFLEWRSFTSRRTLCKEGNHGGGHLLLATTYRGPLPLQRGAQSLSLRRPYS